MTPKDYFYTQFETIIAGAMASAYPGVDVEFPNMEYETLEGTPYVRVTFVAETTIAANLGAPKTARSVGILQFDVFVPAKTGARFAGQIRDTLTGLFRLQQFQPCPGSVVRCRGGRDFDRGMSDPWYHVVGDVSYQRDVQLAF